MALACESKDHTEVARKIGYQFTTPCLIDAAFEGAILACSRGHTPMPKEELARFIRD